MNAQRLPRHAILSRLKKAGVRQAEIAARAGVTQSCVSKVISRSFRGPAPAVDAVWYAVNKVFELAVSRPRAARSVSGNGGVKAGGRGKDTP